MSISISIQKKYPRSIHKVIKQNLTIQHFEQSLLRRPFPLVFTRLIKGSLQREVCCYINMLGNSSDVTRRSHHANGIYGLTRIIDTFSL